MAIFTAIYLFTLRRMTTPVCALHVLLCYSLLNFNGENWFPFLSFFAESKSECDDDKEPVCEPVVVFPILPPSLEGAATPEYSGLNGDEMSIDEGNSED